MAYSYLLFDANSCGEIVGRVMDLDPKSLDDVRAILELIQSLTLEVSEELDAYQERHAP